MSVNRYIIRQPFLPTTTATTINLPLSQTLTLAGQQETIDTKFIDVEVENAINPILDYEVVRFIPTVGQSTTMCDTITYNINLLANTGTNPTTYLSNTFWSDAEISFDDFKFRKNAFIKSFLRLDFYDSDIGTNQRLLFFKTIFASVDLAPITPNSTIGVIPQPSNVLLDFTVGDIMKNRALNSEGFFLYYFKDEVIPTVPKELYMRATFLNAKNGKSISLMSSSDPNIGIDELAQTDSGELYTKYVLSRGQEGYYYRIDTDYSTNITAINNSSSYLVNLYQISVS